MTSSARVAHTETLVNGILHTPLGPAQPLPRRLLGSALVVAALWTLVLGTAAVVVLGPASLWAALLILAAVNFRIFALLLDWLERRSHQVGAGQRSR